MENKVTWERLLGEIIEVIEIIGTPLSPINGKKVVYEEEVLNATKLHHNKILDLLRQAEKEGKVMILNPQSAKELGEGRMEKQYKVGDVVATISKEEAEEVKRLAQEHLAIEKIIKGVMNSLVDTEVEQLKFNDAYWEKLRIKYNLPAPCDLGQDLGLACFHDTAEIIVKRR